MRHKTEMSRRWIAPDVIINHLLVEVYICVSYKTSFEYVLVNKMKTKVRQLLLLGDLVPTLEVKHVEGLLRLDNLNNKIQNNG